MKHRMTRRTLVLGGVAMAVPMPGFSAEEIPIPAEFDECVAIADQIIDTAFEDIYPQIESMQDFVQKKGGRLDHQSVLGLIKSNLELYQRSFDLTDYAKLLEVRYDGKDNEGYDGYFMKFGCEWSTASGGKGTGTVEHTFFF